MAAINVSNVTHVFDAVAAKNNVERSKEPSANPPPTDAVRGITTILPPASIDAVTANIEQNDAQKMVETPNVQVLEEPSAQAAAQASTAGKTLSVNEILAALQQAIYDGSMSTMTARMNVNATLGAHRANTIQEAIHATETAKQKYQDSLKEFHDANGRLSDADQALTAADQALAAAQSNVLAKQKNLAMRAAELDSSPNDATAVLKYKEAWIALNDANAAEGTAQTNYDNTLQARNSAADAAIAAGQASVDAQAEVTLCLDDLTRITNADNASGVPPTSADEFKTAMRVLWESMMKLSELLSQNTEQKLKNDLKLYRDKQTQLQHECEKKSEDFLKAVADAESKQKKMKLIGKCIGWAVTAITVAGAVASGGTLASLVPVAATLLMAAIDEGMDSAGKQTLSSRAMDPVVNALTKGFVDMIKEFDSNVDEQTAQMIAMVLATVTMMVGAAVVMKGAGKGMDALANSSSSNPMIKNALAKLATIGFEGPLSGVNAAKAQFALKTISAGANITNSAMQSGMAIMVAKSTKSAKKDQADMIEIQALLDLIQQIIRDVISGYSKDSGVATNIADKVSSLIQQNDPALGAILRNMTKVKAVPA